jgi:hypothetical protein
MMPTTPRAFAFLILFVVMMTGCATQHPVFDGGDVVSRIDDMRDIPEPTEHEFWRMAHHVDNFTVEQTRQRLNPVPAGPALDVNRLGEVPDSSWYVNRIGSLTPTDVAQGPGGADPGPEAFLPWEITGVKSGGRNPGFIFQDSRGVRYICKFDKHGEPTVATGAGAVAARLLWACGYNVPDDRVVMFERGDLGIADGASLKDEFGRKQPLTVSDIDELLASVPSLRSDGRYRALVSRFLSGRPMGGYAYRGTRDDDPNDVIPHQDRRSLRALRVFGAWLNHVDQKIDNTLDMYVEQDGHRFMRHYLVDFDGCLGGYWAARHESRIGYAYEFDLGEFVSGVPGLGLRRRPYEYLDAAEHVEIGLFEETRYDPATWQPNYLNAQLSACRPADRFWAGTILAQVTDEMIAAAVTAARFDDPKAETILARVLRLRRNHTVAWALESATSVVGIAIHEGQHESWQVVAQFATANHDQVSAELLDRSGQTLQHYNHLDGNPALIIPANDIADRDYFAIRWVATNTDNQKLPPTEAHFYRRNGTWLLAGILRDNQ